MTMTADKIREISEFLDMNAGQEYLDQPLAQDLARIAKVMEELGEALQVFIGITGQNPRKGYIGIKSELGKELLDVATTAIYAYHHFFPNQHVWYELQKHIDYQHKRLIP